MIALGAIAVGGDHAAFFMNVGSTVDRRLFLEIV